MTLAIGRMRVTLNGFAGAPGVNTFFFFGSSPSTFTATDAAQARTALETFFGALKTFYPNTTSILCDSSADILDPVTGLVAGSVSAGAATGITGTGGLSGAPRSAAMCISWSTGQAVGRRILRGRTFLSPTVVGVWGSDGNLQSSYIATATTAAQALVDAAGADLAIWHRPKPLTSGNNGLAANVVSFKINKVGAVLRSRRD